MGIEELDGRVDTLERLVGGHESDGLRTDIQVVGEALQRIRRVLADLVDAADVDADDYAEDLARLETLGKMVRLS